MFSTILFTIVVLYFALLLCVAWYTGRNTTNESFFIGNRNSNWMLVAFGMIGTSLSGVTFISVPGTVQTNHFYYLQIVIGYLIGYAIIAFVLLPLYYKMQLTSIYYYLEKRFGNYAYKTGALFFILSRTIGATARLYLVINVLQLFVLNSFHIPFWATAFIILLMIILYTFKGGVKTIVFTDTLQTSGMLIGLIVCIWYILNSGDGATVNWSSLQKHDYFQLFNTDVKSKTFFLKQIVGGAFITIAMTGLDQEMMQKNISVNTLKLSQRNMLSFSWVMSIVNGLFLILGALLYLYAENHSLALKGDDLFPTIALQHLPQWVAIVFVIALISALFPSADGALTALTSSFCIDLLGIKQKGWSEDKQVKIRKITHISFAIVFMVAIGVFKMIDSKSIINIILDLAGYTYGPLLGLFAFGILTKRSIKDNASIIAICILAPIVSYVLTNHVVTWIGGYQIGIELLLINGLITFTGLYILSTKAK